METNFFTTLSEAITNGLTQFIHAYSGLLQVSVYLVIGVIFFYALVKCWQALRALGRYEIDDEEESSLQLEQIDDRAPLAVVAASFFCKTKNHYQQEEHNNSPERKTIPPDGFIRDAAFQYSERYFEERFLEPISLSANLMPSLGFLGTIIGLVIHFLSNSGSLNSAITISGVATALYTTFIGLLCYTVLEFLLKFFYALSRRRIDEGLGAVAERVMVGPEREEG